MFKELLCKFGWHSWDRIHRKFHSDLIRCTGVFEDTYKCKDCGVTRKYFE